MIQMMPFLPYIPYSPRAKGSDPGFDWATSYAIPWSHVPEFFLSRFVGPRGQTYWSTNGLKLHSEYLGLPVIVLAIFGPARPARAWSLARRHWRAVPLHRAGGITPFYRLW